MLQCCVVKIMQLEFEGLHGEQFDLFIALHNVVVTDIPEVSIMKWIYKYIYNIISNVKNKSSKS